MAIHNPCALLERLLLEPNESTWLEFKVNNKDPREIGNTSQRLQMPQC